MEAGVVFSEAAAQVDGSTMYVMGEPGGEIGLGSGTRRLIGLSMRRASRQCWTSLQRSSWTYIFGSSKSVGDSQSRGLNLPGRGYSSERRGLRAEVWQRQEP